MHQAIRNVPKIFKLSNGITLILDKIASVESVAVSVWLGVGSRFESKEQSGISHFLEHMAFKGTNTRDAKQIAEAFDDLGVYFNANTSREHTAYYAKAAKEDLSTVVDLIADILLNSTFPKEEIEKERSVILQEISRTNDTPDDLIFDKYIEACYPDQPFGRSILGQAETVGAFTRQDFIDYTQKHYVASNTVISLAGNFSNDEAMCELFEKKFSAMPHSSTASYAAPAVYKPGKYVVNKDLEQVQIVLAWPSIDNGSLSGNIRPVIATNLFSSAFGGGMSSRLFQRIREQLGLAYSVYSFLSAYNDAGVFSIYAGIAPEKVVHVIEEIRAEMTKAISITDDELHRAKKQYAVPLRMLCENTMSVCKYNGRNFITHHKVYTIEEVLDIVEQITKKELEQCAQQILSEAPKVTCAVIGRVSPRDIEIVLSQAFGNVQNG